MCAFVTLNKKITYLLTYLKNFSDMQVLHDHSDLHQSEFKCFRHFQKAAYYCSCTKLDAARRV